MDIKVNNICGRAEPSGQCQARKMGRRNSYAGAEKNHEAYDGAFFKHGGR